MPLLHCPGEHGPTPAGAVGCVPPPPLPPVPPPLVGRGVAEGCGGVEGTGVTVGTTHVFLTPPV